MQTALSKLQSILVEKNFDGFIVTNPYNILYLCGFKGISPTEREAILTVTKNGATLITARLYQTEAKTLASRNLKIKIAAERNEINNFIKASLKNASTIGFEETDLKYGEFIKYKKLLSPSPAILESRQRQDDRIFNSSQLSASKYSSNALRVKSAKQSNIRMSSSPLFSHSRESGNRDKLQRGSGFSIESRMTLASSRLSASNNKRLTPTKNLIEDLRVIKSEEEVSKIERAQQITQKAFEKILKTIKVSQTEAEISHKLSSIIRNLGGDGLAFETIIASGLNSGKPHHVTSNRRLTTNDTLLFDFGAKYQNYCADFSRTVFIGIATDVQRNIFNHVLTAQKKALDIIKHGIKHHEAFHTANNHFKANKLDNYFTHSLGHGIGLEVHEAPYLRSKVISNQQLTNGMVFSVEPGLYFGWGGVRIEDLITIQNGKVKVLGKLTNSLVIA